LTWMQESEELLFTETGGELQANLARQA